MPHKVIFLDTETTSVNTEEAGVFQISGIIDVDGKIVEEINIFTDIFPGDLVDPAALQGNGKNIEEIHSYQYPKKAFVELNEFLGKHCNKFDRFDKLIAIGYNSDFDNRVLRSFFKKNNDQYFGSWFWVPWLDVMQIAAYMYQEQRKDFENFKMSTVAKHLGFNPEQDKLHDALYDIQLTREVYYRLIQ
jgi:DNA polymerase-3 subunit epsilon